MWAQPALFPPQFGGRTDRLTGPKGGLARAPWVQSDLGWCRFDGQMSQDRWNAADHFPFARGRKDAGFAMAFWLVRPEPTGRGIRP